MSNKSRDRIFIFYLYAAALNAILCLIDGLWVSSSQTQISLLSNSLATMGHLLFALSLGTLFISLIYQSKRSNYVLALSLLLLSGPFISTPFIYSIARHVKFFDFITQMNNFNFLMNSGYAFKTYFFIINILQLSIAGLAILFIKHDVTRFYELRDYSISNKRILLNGTFVASVFVCSFVAYIIGPLYLLHAGLGISYDQGNIISVEKTFSRNDVKIVLLPMAHIGDASFYQSIVSDYSSQQAVFLLEGVKDQKGLIIKGDLFYSSLAKTLGMAEQKGQFKFPKKTTIRFVWADVDVSELSQQTIDFINLLSVDKNSDKGIGLEHLGQISQMMAKEETSKIIFSDILNFRNERLLTKLNEELTKSKLIVIPWGAAHMHDIEMQIKKIGFEPTLEVKRILTQVWRGNDRVPASKIQ